MTPALPFHLATFAGAFLLFLVQPLMAKQILPWFGGAPAVWTTCLLFFQVGLVGGYLYAHVSRRLGRRLQVWVHLSLLAAAILMLPIIASPAWKPPDASQPALRLLGLLTVTVAFPYVMLSATAPLVQDWFRLAVPGRSPYRLYVLSNAGSLLALLSYPIVVERYLSVDVQAYLWSAAFVVFAGTCALCAWQMRRATGGAAGPAAVSSVRGSARPPALDVTLWVLLAACASGLLLAVTNQLCQDVAVVPLLWIVPLSLYLATFIVCFADLYRRAWWVPLFVAGLAGTGYALAFTTSLSVPLQAAALLLLLTAACMICHGELVRIRPAGDHLTAFYLALSVGGAVGGLFVALAAPALFVSYAELPFLALLVPVLLVATMFRDQSARRATPLPAWLVLMPVIVFSGVVVNVLRQAPAGAATVAASRNFYGILRATEGTAAGDRRIRRFYHGRVLHGAQFLDPGLANVPTAYFGEGSGVALALAAYRRGRGGPIRMGVVGLGVGTLSAWGRPGDLMRFFELNPAVVEYARSFFTFLHDSPAAIDVVTGDGRLALEREMASAAGHASYDVLVIDAFSGDSVPAHLLTRECFELYWTALRPDGALAIHISNHFLDLEPVVRGVADELHLDAVKLVGEGDPVHATRRNEWMVVSRNPAVLNTLRESGQAQPAAPGRLVWTDRYSSLVSVLR